MTKLLSWKIGRRAALTAAAAGGAVRLAVAQSRFPSRAVSIVVPIPAGGGTDYAARLISAPMGILLGQPVVVENRPGGNDVIGLMYVARSQPDGHTLLMGYCGTMAGRAAIGGTGNVSTADDFVPIGQVSDTPQLLVVHPSLPVNNLQELIAYTKANPGKVSYASAGNGSMHHLGTELLKSRTGMDMLHVPYRGTGETIGDLIAGRVQFYMNSPPPLVSLVRDGKVRALCVSSNERHPGLPEVPSLAESGLHDLPLNVWFALFAPKAIPADVRQKLSEALERSLADEDLKRRAFEAGSLVKYAGPEDVARRLRSEIAGWRATAQAANIRAD
ncbi:tripartite tricarboxylate transporter substrate binding protein [Belnapia sp. T6]|uniref:Tripartite tricarboxylate transporter substrate binding protein n=1 Tax=Belnapia mucosa TaxID=2804532 RepID=A0ABS1VBW0_9PROT|nr:tripartite tricarboxylate transporter substrate binding protein [Belnapia mucosa]MBL6458224.1 tripartite tricarboxylate transporter substrate binding protein [Belnapia mucosa]